MPRASDLKQNFYLGEVSPLAKGQLRSEQYKSAVDYLKNYFVTPQGALIRRSGTEYVGYLDDTETPTDGVIKFFTFKISESEVYVIAAGHGDNDAWNAWSVSDRSAITVSEPGASGNLSISQRSQAVAIGSKFYVTTNNGLEFVRRTTGPTLNVYRWSGGAFDDALDCFGPYNTPLTLDSGAASTITMGPSTTTATLGNAVTLTATASIFNANMVGRTIRVYDGPNQEWHVLYINGYTSPTVVATVSIRNGNNFGGTGTGNFTSWAFEVFSRLDGYGATAIGFHQNRLILATDLIPNRLYFSDEGDYQHFDFSNTASPSAVVATSSFHIDLGGPEQQIISSIYSDKRKLFVKTTGSELIIEPPDETNGAFSALAVPYARVISNRGSAFGRHSIPAGQNGVATLSKGKTRVIHHGANPDINVNDSVDVSTLSEHLFRYSANELHFQEDPYPRLFVTKFDGETLNFGDNNNDNFGAEIIVGLYLPEQQIFAPGRMVLGGSGNAGGDPPQIISATIAPSADGTRDELWLLTERYINGATQKVVEVLSQDFASNLDFEDGIFLDCAIVGNYSEPIIAATKANPCVVTMGVTTTAFANTNVIYIEGVTGMTTLNGTSPTLAGKSGNTFQLSGVNSSAYGTFTKNKAARARLVYTSLTQSLFANEVMGLVRDGIVGNDVTLNGSGVASFSAAKRVSIGYAYDSDLRLLTPEAGSALGTAMGKTQRVNRVSVRLDRTFAIKMGKDFDNLNSIIPSSATDLFTGTKSQTLNSNYGLDTKICFRQDTPGPGAILAITLHMGTYDR
jgi:hypothetical protein